MNNSIAGDDYVAAMSRRPSDVECRATFQTLALSLVARGGSVFDFGCGPGLDARDYAACGRRVIAYDADPRMCDCFDRLCAADIDAGRVRLIRASYADFLGNHDDGERFDLITANFAPLNLVEDLPPLIARLAAMLSPGGRVLASLLNPYFAADLRFAWWWRNLGRFALRGRYSVAGADSRITRYSPHVFARLAGPLRLEGLYGARPVSGSLPRRITKGAPLGWLSLLSSRYLFVVLHNA
jgi:SAM-dependent methyltransferase